MDYYLRVTHNDWYRYLKSTGATEANLWSLDDTKFRAVKPYEPFLFKLRMPQHKYIGGGGIFIKKLVMPMSQAWEVYGNRNGASTWQEFRDRVFEDPKATEVGPDPMLGCQTLQDLFFIPEDELVDVPSDWSDNIRQGKTYSTLEGPGREPWVRAFAYSGTVSSDAVEETDLYTETTRVRNRLGQANFRALVTDAYQSQCAISGGKTWPVLDAAHIKPRSKKGPSSVANGLLLRSDIHRLFDRGFMTVTPDYQIEVSKEIKRRFKNGHEYRRFHGNKLMLLPDNALELPSRSFLDWHNSNVYERFG